MRPNVSGTSVDSGAFRCVASLLVPGATRSDIDAPRRASERHESDIGSCKHLRCRMTCAYSYAMTNTLTRHPASITETRRTAHGYAYMVRVECPCAYPNDTYGEHDHAACLDVIAEAVSR